MRKIKKLLNPENHIDGQFVYLLKHCIIHTFDSSLDEETKLYSAQLYISQALNYKAVGWICKDCDQRFDDCTCEGSRDIIKPGSRSRGKTCEDCNQNRCICDYEINTIYKARKVILELAKKYLNREQLQDFKLLIIRSIPSLSLTTHDQDKLINFANKII